MLVLWKDLASVMFLTKFPSCTPSSERADFVACVFPNPTFPNATVAGTWKNVL